MTVAKQLPHNKLGLVGMQEGIWDSGRTAQRGEYIVT
jgi:hypothetical protein